MKLVEILARELKEWPATTACFAQDDDGDIYNYVSTFIVRDEGEWEGADDAYLDHSFDYPGLYGQDLATDHKTAIVTREMWEHERAKSAQWKNGLPPVGTVCEIQHEAWGNSRWVSVTVLYASNEYIITAGPVNEQHWHAGSVKFRPIKTHEQIAAEERKIVIDEMIGVFDCVPHNLPPISNAMLLEIYDLMYEAGYRRLPQARRL